MKPYEEMRRFYIEKFQEKGESVIPILCSISVAKTVFLDAYKNLTPIEEMGEKEKNELKIYVHEMFPGEPVEFKLNACKIIYTLGNLI